MVYKLLNAWFVECKCHSDKIKNKSDIKPKFVDDCEDYIEMEQNVSEYMNRDTIIPSQNPMTNIPNLYSPLMSASPNPMTNTPNAYSPFTITDENMEIELQTMNSNPVLSPGSTERISSDGKTYY